MISKNNCQKVHIVYVRTVEEHQLSVDGAWRTLVSIYKVHKPSRQVEATKNELIIQDDSEIVSHSRGSWKSKI